MVEVCDICGDRGFSNALLDCSECSDACVHQYCLGLRPGSIDDTFDWFCESCSVPMEFESCGKFGGAFSLGVSKSGRGDLEMENSNEIVPSPEQPEPLCALLPMEYQRNFSRENTSNLSEQHEASISSFMEHPDSIMRGLVLLVSPSGEVFIDEENHSYEFSYFSSLASHILNMTSRSKNSGTYKVKRELSPKTVEKHVDSAETIGLDGRKLRSLSEINARLSTSTNAIEHTKRHVDGLNHELSSLESKGKNGRVRKSFGYPEENEDTARKVDSRPKVRSNNSVGSSLKDLKKGTRKRTFEPEEEVIQQKKASVCKDEPDSEEDTDEELSLGEALARKQRSVRDKIVTMLIDAGWTVECRPRSGRPKAYTKVYISPDGYIHWSVPSAYKKLEEDVKKAKATNSEVGGSGNSEFCFKPLPDELLSLLSKRFKQEKKKWMNERKS